MSNKSIILGVLAFAAFIAVNSSFYIITEGRQAIVTQFGKPVGLPITKAGVHFKKPFVQDIRYVDKRILNWDGFPNQIPTRDKKYIQVDTTARWLVIDALKFIQTVQNEQGAKARLDTILDGHTRNIISGHNLVEAVRNSDDILEKIKEKDALIKKRRDRGESILEEEIGGEIDSISIGREKLSQMIVTEADKDLEALGIKLIDLQLRRISYEQSVEQKVYERMISERQRIAQKIRSIGKGEKAIIEGRLSKDLREIESRAYREAEGIRGKAEALATAIYAKSLNSDPQFYEFMRTMDAYKTSIKPNTKLLLSSQSEFLKYFK